MSTHIGDDPESRFDMEPAPVSPAAEGATKETLARQELGYRLHAIAKVGLSFEMMGHQRKAREVEALCDEASVAIRDLSSRLSSTEAERNRLDEQVTKLMLSNFEAEQGFKDALAESQKAREYAEFSRDTHRNDSLGLSGEVVRLQTALAASEAAREEAEKALAFERGEYEEQPRVCTVCGNPHVAGSVWISACELDGSDLRQFCSRACCDVDTADRRARRASRSTEGEAK